MCITCVGSVACTKGEGARAPPQFGLSVEGKAPLGGLDSSSPDGGFPIGGTGLSPPPQWKSSTGGLNFHFPKWRISPEYWTPPPPN